MGKLNVTITLTTNDELYPVEMSSDDAVTKLKETVEIVSGMPPAQQVLVLNGKALPDGATLAQAGVSDGDVIMAAPQQAAAQRAPSRGGSEMQAFARDPRTGEAAHPEAFIQAVQGSEAIRNQLRVQMSMVVKAVEASDPVALQKALRENFLASQIPDDPLDPEYQRRVYEHMQQEAINENRDIAIEHAPEAFVHVDMLYVDMTANGEPLKVFVDSGAQMTIMTAACAEKCNVMRLVDTRHAGMAVGVGSSKILGRIHACELRVADQYIMTSITVLEQKGGPQCIFGLDNLKRHHCCIDLRRGRLVVGSCDVELPFLQAQEVPNDFNVKRQESGAPEAQGSHPPAAEGDLSVLKGPGGSAPEAAATQQAPEATAGAGASEAHVKQLQDLTGASADECRAALQQAGGNVDAAAGQLMGW